VHSAGDRVGVATHIRHLPRRRSGGAHPQLEVPLRGHLTRCLSHGRRSKTGGLGDVMGSLPAALAARGHRVMVRVSTGPLKCNWRFNRSLKMQLAFQQGPQNAIGVSIGPLKCNWRFNRALKMQLAFQQGPQNAIGVSTGPSKCNWRFNRSLKMQLAFQQGPQNAIGVSIGPLKCNWRFNRALKMQLAF
jgi:hypothetical protein